MDARLLFPKEFLCAADLQGKDCTLTIARLASEDLRTEKGKESKWVLCFVEMEDRKKKDKKKIAKKLVLNKTNAKSIAKLYGNETDDWKGKPITLYATRCDAFGETVDCIRIRDRVVGRTTKAASDEPPDWTDEDMARVAEDEAAA